MARTITYRSTKAQRDQTPVFRGQQATETPPDSYSDRLVRFVPAEVLAFFVPAAANWSDDETALIVILITGLLATPLYLWVRGRDNQPVTWWFYILATIAFFAWAAGTSGATSELLGMSERAGTLALALAAFLIPLLDEVLDKAVAKPRR
jgi:hypothetical protein